MITLKYVTFNHTSSNSIYIIHSIQVHNFTWLWNHSWPMPIYLVQTERTIIKIYIVNKRKEKKRNTAQCFNIHSAEISLTFNWRIAYSCPDNIKRGSNIFLMSHSKILPSVVPVAIISYITIFFKKSISNLIMH